jgi:hypothetical protein
LQYEIIPTNTNISDLDALPPTVQDFAKSIGAEVTGYALELDYDYWTSGW